MAFRMKTSTLMALWALLIPVMWLGYGPAEAWAEPPSKLLILPFHIDAQDGGEELEEFGRRVDESIRAAVTQFGEMLRAESADAVRQLLQDGAPPSTETDAIALGKRANADILIYGFLQKSGDRFRMKGTMRDMRTGRTTVASDFEVDNIRSGLNGVLKVFLYNVAKRLHGAPKLPLHRADSPLTAGGVNGKPTPSQVSLTQDRGPWMSPKVTPLRGLEIGDLDGDKRNEVVFVGADGITISRFEGGSLRPLTQFSQPPQVYLSAQAEDIDGDGVCELILCYETPDGLESSIIQYKHRNLKTFKKLPNMIVRSILDPSREEGNILVGQRTDSKTMLSGEMVVLRMNSDDVTEEGKIALPPGTLLLSYVSGRLGKESTFVQVILNQDQRLMVFDGGNRLLAHITERLYGVNRTIRVTCNGKKQAILLPGRLIISDTDGDGENELLVIRPIHRSGSVIEDLVWRSNELTSSWKTIGTGGLIADFRIRDFKNQGSRSLVVILVKSDYFLSLTGRAYSVVYAYDLAP